MMLKRLLIATTLFLTTHAHAGFVEYDWQNAGDKKAVLHEETGLEWLDLTETQGSYNGTLARLAPGGDLEGWRVATYDEVYSMLSALAGATISATTNYIGSTAPHIDAYHAYKNLFGTVTDGGGNELVMKGLYLNASSAIRSTQALYTIVNSTLYAGIRVEQSSGMTASSNVFGYGTFLVSTGGLTLGASANVGDENAGNPLPTDVALPPLGFAAAGLGLMFLVRRRPR